MTMIFPFEEWRKVPSAPGLEASSLGRVRITPHGCPVVGKGQCIRGGKPTFGSWAVTRFIFTRRGYPTYRVARLICEAFHGPAPLDKQYCLHEDENSRNNKPDNLRWGTQKENLNYPKFIEHCKSRTGENNPFRKGKAKLHGTSE